MEFIMHIIVWLDHYVLSLSIWLQQSNTLWEESIWELCIGTWLTVRACDRETVSARKYLPVSWDATWSFRHLQRSIACFIRKKWGNKSIGDGEEKSVNASPHHGQHRWMLGRIVVLFKDWARARGIVVDIGPDDQMLLNSEKEPKTHTDGGNHEQSV